MLQFDTPITEPLCEDFSYESFVSWAARKLKGYSVKEIDHLAKRVVNIDTHEEKTDVIERIRDAIKSAQAKVDKIKEDLQKEPDDTANKEQKKYMEEHLSILKVLLSKAQAFNIVDHLEGKKNPPSEGDEKKVYRIDDNT
jgi:hypothetical protein